MRTETIQLSTGDQTNRGEIIIAAPSSGSCMMKALGLGVVMLLATGVAALIPVVHFITVPVMLLVTLVVVVNALKGGEFIEEAKAQCPACGAPFRIMRRKYRLPFGDVCEKCHRQVLVSKPD